jgi:hypothetical protein
MILPAILASISAIVLWIAAFNVSGRKREREIQTKRGVQDASAFASLFHTPSERFIAEKLYPYLQLQTFTKKFSFRETDLLWIPPLRFVEDDLWDDLQAGFWDEIGLGLTAEASGFAESIISVSTVGELVRAVAKIYSNRYSVDGVHSER